MPNRVTFWVNKEHSLGLFEELPCDDIEALQIFVGLKDDFWFSKLLDHEVQSDAGRVSRGNFCVKNS